MADHDIIVVGAGHNSLVAAAYLARAGLDVLVLERHDQPGGGAVSRSVTLPGFVHDTHAQVAAVLQGSPIVTHDELDLIGKHGLTFNYGQLSDMTIFDDGDTLSIYVDLDRTCAEIAKYSAKDADAYRKLVVFMQEVMPLMGMAMARPPVSFGNFASLIERMPFGNRLLTMMMMSSYDLVTEMYEHPKVIMHFMKWVADSNIAPETKATGTYLLFLAGSVHAGPVGGVRGGTQELTRATIASFEAAGGTLRLNAHVQRIIPSPGGPPTVRLADGETLAARRAVVASIHPAYLGETVEGLAPDLVDRARKVQPSDLGVLSLHLALDEKPRWSVGTQPDECVHFNMVDVTDIEAMRRGFDDIRYGDLPGHFTGGGVVPTVLDPSRAPAGKHVAFFYFFAPYALRKGGAAAWDDVKDQVGDQLLERIARYAPNISGGTILGRHVESPLDMERWSRSFHRGDTASIGNFLYQSLGMRPIPELAQYRVPGAEGLYLCGPSMHPGGGLSGGGRAVAIRVMEDLGVDYDRVIKI